MKGLVWASEGRAVGPTVASKTLPLLPVARAAELQGKGPHGEAASGALQQVDHGVPGYADAGSRGNAGPQKLLRSHAEYSSLRTCQWQRR
jgi:hypothetical protein